MAMEMRIEAASGLPEGETILVHVEHDDGYVAYAMLDTKHYRCWVNTASRSAHWELGRGGDWHGVVESDIDLPQRLRVSMHRAAVAGLVAVGAIGVRY